MEDSFVYLNTIGEPEIGHCKCDHIKDEYIVFSGTDYECHAYVSGYYTGRNHGEMNARKI